MTQLLVFNVTNGLIIGTFYVLMALGLSLILNLSNVINFAHGGFLVLGGYIAYTITPYVGFWGALLIAPPLTALIGLVVERVLIRPLYGRDPLYSLLLTFGLAFIIEDGTRFIWGAQGKPVTIPAVLAQPLSDEFFFITGYRLFMVAMVVFVVALLFVLLRYTRLGIRIRAGTLDLETVAAMGINVAHAALVELRSRYFPRRAERRARRRSAWPRAHHGHRPADAELHRHHRRRRRQPHRHLAWRIADRRGLGRHCRISARRQRSDHVRADGRDPAGPAARTARRRRHADMSEPATLSLKRLRALGAQYRGIALVAIWAILLLAPYWMPPLGGYTALGTRVLVLGLAAMSVNFLLGFTGVLSFGHAAYFGLGAYGAGFALKFLAPSTPLSILCGMLLGGVIGALLGALIVRRRGVYFAMVTIAFGQVFYYIAFQWSSRHRRRRRLARLLASAARFRPVHHRYPVEQQRVLLLRAVLLRARSRRHGVHSALAVRAHHDRDPRE